MTRKPLTVAFWRGRLPHWEVVEGRYFVTIHLAGAIPPQGHERIHVLAAELDKLSDHDADRWLTTQRRIFGEMEAWLDRAESVRHLQNPDVAQMVVEAIAFREARVWHMLEYVVMPYVVMPSHVHLFFELATGGLKEHLEQFKRWTGHAAAKLLKLDEGRFWQDEWFDHWSRSEEEDQKIIQYIRDNPEKAGLVGNYLEWPFGGWRRPTA